MIGTCKMNIIGNANNENVREAVRIIAKHNIRNDWILIRAYDGPKKLVTFTGPGSKIKNKIQKEKNKKKVAPKCGYIVGKDMKVVVFYTNNLIDTPTKNFLHSTNESDSEEAIRCVDGLAYVERWDDDCRNTRKKLFVQHLLLYTIC